MRLESIEEYAIKELLRNYRLIRTDAKFWKRSLVKKYCKPCKKSASECNGCQIYKTLCDLIIMVEAKD